MQLINVTPYNFIFDGIEGNLFIDLYRFLLSQSESKEDLPKILKATQDRLLHASLKLPFIEGRSSLDAAFVAIMKLESLVAAKLKAEHQMQPELDLDAFIKEKFGIQNFEYFFDDVQKKRMDITLLNFRKDLIGQQSEDRGVDYISRAKSVRSPVLQLVAFSSVDFDLAHQLRMIGNVLGSEDKRQAISDQSYKVLGWLEAQYNFIGVQELGTPLSRIKNPLSDTVFNVKNLVSLETEKIGKFPGAWPSKRLCKSYLESGSNIETLYFNWAISVLRELIVWAGLSKSDANKAVEEVYRHLGVDLNWSGRMGNTGGTKKASLPDPFEIFFQFRSLIAFFDSANIL